MKDKILYIVYENLPRSVFMYFLVIIILVAFVMNGSILSLFNVLKKIGLSTNEILLLLSIIIPTLFYILHAFLTHKKYKEMFGIFWKKNIPYCPKCEIVMYLDDKYRDCGIAECNKCGCIIKFRDTNGKQLLIKEAIDLLNKTKI